MLVRMAFITTFHDKKVMLNLNKYFIIGCMALGLTACNEQPGYNYLVQHPIVLKQKIDECQSAANQNQPQSSECEIVFYAAANFISVQDEAMTHPEQLGQRVLDVESLYVKDKMVFLTAKQVLDGLQGRNAPDKDIQTAKYNLTKAQKDYEDKDQEMRFLLAVIGLNSPE